MKTLALLLVFVPFVAHVTATSVSAGQVGQINAGTAPAQPPRDATKPVSGTATLRGRVVAAETGAPLRKVAIRLTAPELRESRQAVTDADGRYEFKELAAGRYQLTAFKGSFVTLSYGQTRPFQPGTPLDVKDGQTIEKIDFSLPRGAVITGRVLDELGEPQSDVRIVAMRYQYQNGRRQLAMVGGRTAVTDDTGAYRLFGLPPGQYYLAARLMTMPGIGGDEDRSGYGPTYYPGAGSPADAQRVTVGLGATVGDINISLVPVRMSRITGQAFDEDGKPITRGMVMPMQQLGAPFIQGFSSPAQLQSDGTFTLNGVAPGDYTLRAQGIPTDFGQPPAVATAKVTVTGDDLSGVRLIAQPAGSVSGRVVLPAGTETAIKPATIHITPVPGSPDEAMGFMGMPEGVRDDFTFELRARPGKLMLRINVQSTAWSLKAVRADGVDVTDSGIDVRPGQGVSGVEIELTNRPTDVSGAVTDARGSAVKDFVVVAFARDAQQWTFMTRRIASARPDQEGKYRLRALPPGDYYVAAVESLEPGEAGDPEFLGRLRDRASSFSLAEGEVKVVDLKMTALP